MCGNKVIMSSLAGKVAIITGASSGIGAATAVQFAKLGALVAITGRNEDNLRSTAQQCKEQGGAEPLLIGQVLVFLVTETEFADFAVLT